MPTVRGEREQALGNKGALPSVEGSCLSWDASGIADYRLVLLRQDARVVAPLTEHTPLVPQTSRRCIAEKRELRVFSSAQDTGQTRDARFQRLHAGTDRLRQSNRRGCVGHPVIAKEIRLGICRGCGVRAACTHDAGLILITASKPCSANPFWNASRM